MSKTRQRKKADLQKFEDCMVLVDSHFPTKEILKAAENRFKNEAKENGYMPKMFRRTIKVEGHNIPVTIIAAFHPTYGD